MNCLVTGGAGFIGSHIVHGLLARGDGVRVLDDLSSGLERNLADVADDVDLRVADLRDPEAVAAACNDVEVVYHEAAVPSVPRSVDDPLTSFSVNAGGTLNLLLAARDAGVRRVVYAASSSVYGDTPTLPKHEGMLQNPRSPYAADKVHGENLCKVFTATWGLECVALRYFNVFGPRQRADSDYAAVIPNFIHASLEGRPATIHGDGRQSRDFTFVTNVVQANLLAAEAAGAGGRSFNVACGERCDLLELLAAIQKACGVSIPPEHAAPRAGDVRDSLAALDAAREVLGYEPSISLEEGLRQTVAWFRAQEEETS